MLCYICLIYRTYQYCLETSVPAATGKKKGKNNKKGKDKGQEAAADTTAAPEEPADLSVVVPADTPDVDTTVMEELRQKLRDLEGEHVLVVQQLESSLSAAQAASAAAGAELQQVSAQLSKINAEVAGYVDKQVAWKTREAELLAQAEALESAKNHLAQELSATSTQSSSLQQEQKSKLTNLRAKIAELEEALRSSETAEGLAQQQLRELRASQADHESKLTYHMERAVALELQLQQVQDKSVQQSAQHSAALSAIAQEADDLRAQIASLKLSGDSSASALAATVDKLTAELRVALEQLEASQTAEKTISEELAALKETSVQTESTNKKLMTKLKLKMKECTDLSAELVSAKDTASKSASAEATSSALSEQMQVLQTSLAKVSDAKAELELKSKALNDSVIAGEEKVSALLREKNKLQEDLFTTLHKVESITKEAQGFKTERDLARQQYLDMESKLQGLSSTSREKIDSLSTKVAELSTVNATLSAQNTTLNEALALSNSEITTLKESSSALSQANSKSKGLAATVESLKQQLQEAKMDAENKAEASNERIKKLKLLLTKVNAVSQEKDARLAQLQSLNDRAKKFNIVTRIGVVPPQDPTAEPLEWCLIYEHRSPPAKNGTSSAAAGTDEDSTSSQYRWIEARVAHKWMAEGSTLIGAWPQPVQETWSTEMNALRSRLEAERDEIASKFEEISSQFQTYKVRAQTALKRIGNEDRNERQKAQELESAEIERLRGVIQDLKEKEGDFNEVLSEKVRSIASKDQAIQELQGKIEQLETTIADGEQAYKANERKIGTLQKEIEALVQDSQNMKEQYEAADRSNRERRMQQLRSEEEAALRIATMPQATISSAGSSTSATSAAMSSRNSGQNLQDHSQLDSAASEASSGSALGPSTDSRPMSPKDLDANGSFLHSQQSQQVVSPLRVMSRTPSQSLPSASPRGRSLALEAALSSDLQEGSSTDSKLLLFQQVERFSEHFLRFINVFFLVCLKIRRIASSEILLPLSVWRTPS